MRLATLTRRQDFIAAAKDKKSRKWVTPTVIVQCMVDSAIGDQNLETAQNPTKSAQESVIRVGYTATKRLGNAVIRNRIRRRLKAAAEALLPRLGKQGFAYVLIGRAYSQKSGEYLTKAATKQGTKDCAFQCLLDDLETALVKLHAPHRNNHRKNDNRSQKHAEKQVRNTSNSTGANEPRTKSSANK